MGAITGCAGAALPCLSAGKARSGAVARLRRPRRGEQEQRNRASLPELMGEQAERKGFPAEGQAGIGCGPECGGLEERSRRVAGGAESERKPPLSGRAGKSGLQTI
jgi:hypothetical protein